MVKANIVVGLDVGSSKVAAMAGEVKDDGTIEIIGVGFAPSPGISKGVVTSIESTVEAINKAVTEAKMMAGVTIGEAYLSLSGAHIRGANSNGTLPIKHPEISQEDVDQVLEQAQAVAMPVDRMPLHCLVQEFIVDTQDGIKVPLGMSGVRLEAKTFLVNTSRGATENFIKCCQKCGIEVSAPVLSPLASAYSVLTEDERNLGVVLVDIGAGTSDIIIYYRNAVVFTSVLSLGGSYITNDIAMGLRTPMADAEDLKKRYGHAVPARVDADEVIDVPRVGGKEIRQKSRQTLCSIIEARTEEILNMVKEEIEKSAYRDLVGAGVVLTGGVTNMGGVLELADEIFNMPVRIGMPRFVSRYPELVENPEFATTVGLLYYGAEQLAEQRKRRRGSNHFLSRFVQWIMNA